jgi:hypothetical protein
MVRNQVWESESVKQAFDEDLLSVGSLIEG